MSAGLWSGIHYSLKTDAWLQLLHMFGTSGLVPSVWFGVLMKIKYTKLNQVLKISYMGITSGSVSGGEGLLFPGIIMHAAGSIYF